MEAVYIDGMDQGSPEWHQIRNGRFTGSCAFKLVAEAKRDMSDAEKLKYKEDNPKGRATTIVDPALLATGAVTYTEQVASERLTGMPAEDDFDTFAMRWGKDHEPKAKQLLKLGYDIEGRDIGFITYGDTVGYSPDWIVNDKFGVEIKCPQSRAIHLKYRSLANADDFKANHPNHYWQIQMGLMVTGFKMWKFVSYHPHYPALKQIKIINVPRDEADIALLKIKLESAEKQCKFLLTV